MPRKNTIFATFFYVYTDAFFVEQALTTFQPISQAGILGIPQTFGVGGTYDPGEISITAPSANIIEYVGGLIICGTAIADMLEGFWLARRISARSGFYVGARIDSAGLSTGQSGQMVVWTAISSEYCGPGL